MNTFAIVSLGVATGFATGVWGVLCWYAWRQRRRLTALAYLILSISNLVSTTLLLWRLRGYVNLRLPANWSVTILIMIVALPPLLIFIPWLKTQAYLGKR